MRRKVVRGIDSALAYSPVYTVSCPPMATVQLPRSLRRPAAWLNHERAPWILGGMLSILALIQAVHKAGQGRCALLKWDWAFEAFFDGGALYGVGAEGYPTLPFSLLLMSPFHLAGGVLGAFLWAAFKVGLAWWIVTRALRLLHTPQPCLQPAAVLFLIAISFRPLLSDITHGNLNLVVGATVASAAWSWSRGREFRTGLWFGIGTVLKVTPALGAILLIRKRSWRGLLGMGVGILAGLTLPALVLGWSRNMQFTIEWWDQMVQPYLASRELTLMQTEHINQSLFGVLARLLTDSVAIPAGSGGLLEDVSIHVLALSSAAFHRVHQIGSVLILGFLLWKSSGARTLDDLRQRGSEVLAEFSMLALAMLFLSERSWKHHYVLLVFPLAFLLAQATCGTQRRLARAAIATAVLLFGFTGSGFLGAHGSNLAEAYGVYFFGGLVLFVACGLLARHPVALALPPLEPRELHS